MVNALAFSLNSRAAHSAKNAPCEVADRECSSSPLHLVAPCSPQQHEADDMGSSTGASGRNLGSAKHQTRTNIHGKFVRHFSEPSKVVARKVGQSADTVDLYKQTSVPQAWAQFAEYCRANPAFALDILEDLGIDIDQDRNAYTLFLQLQKTVRGE